MYLLKNNYTEYTIGTNCNIYIHYRTNTLFKHFLVLNHINAHSYT